MAKRKKLTKAQMEKREAATFRRKIVNTFKNSGFEYLKTENIHKLFGLKKGEIDYVFLYENILVFCEDTTTGDSDKIKKHLGNKKLLTDQIIDDRKKTIEWLQDTFADKFSKFDKYSPGSYRIFHLYFPLNRVNLDDYDIALYHPIKVIRLKTLNYLHITAGTIKKSARNEIFRMLGVKSIDVGSASDSTINKTIRTPIIYPTDNTGLDNGIRVVSFMMSADTLMRNGYVLRKDNWEDTVELYQRLLQKSKLLRTRRFIASKGTTFFNNIIVSLPKKVTFSKNDKPINLEEVSKYENCEMTIPDEMNSIRIIDGQHRIFAHYEGDDALETTISQLRRKLHLLVTGLLFPTDMSELERKKYESEIFEDINSNAKPVPADVLLQIKSLQEPFADLTIARRVLISMNESGIFRDRFQISQMETGKIKVASIIKYALRYLVEITNDPDKPSLFQYWGGDKERLLLKNDEKLLEEYIEYLKRTINEYFSTIQDEYKSDWDNSESKILSITSINGFIIALRKSLPAYGVKDRAFYSALIKNHRYNFSRTGFVYGSSHYNKFAEAEILPKSFKLARNADGDWRQQGS